jgi:eukaryotic-like serine/threonine-protein kinase
MNCLGEETVLQFVRRNLSEEARSDVDAHLADCSDCRALVAEVAQSVLGHDTASGTSFDEPRRPESALALNRGALVDRYIIGERIAVGGMGVLYAAHDPRLNRKVALKLLREDHRAASPRRQAYLLREAQAMARLAHPNVVSVFDAGTYAEQVFIAMEFVDGRTLRAWLEERPRVLREILSVFLDAGRGLAAAHDAGIVHRDFKPTNVMVGFDGRVRVTDFGLARQMEALSDVRSEASNVAAGLTPSELAVTQTRTGALVGTPAYMAPEQLRCERPDARSDQWSFCIALHEALYGDRPTRSAAPFSSAPKDTSSPTTRDVPPRIRDAIDRGLSPARDDRFPSMGGLLEALASELAEGGAKPARNWGIFARAALVAAVGAGVVASVVATRRETVRASERGGTTPSLPASDSTGAEASTRTGSTSATASEPQPSRSPPRDSSYASERTAQPAPGPTLDRATKVRVHHAFKARPPSSASSAQSNARPYDDQPLAPTFGP